MQLHPPKAGARAFLRKLAALLAPFAALAAVAATPILENQIARPLRYTPDSSDFVITNGAEFFNRPLYGHNSAFRVDAGDKPEFSLYLPGRGGNLRLGLKSASGAKWLSAAQLVVARYTQGRMTYEIHDPLLNGATLRIGALPMDTADGLVVRVELQGASDGLQLVWAYGGVNGQPGSRGGDIGTEGRPISEYFQLQPSFCAGNEIQLNGSQFTLRSRPANIAGVLPAGSKLAVANATKWASVDDLLASAGNAAGQPVVVGQVALRNGPPLFLALQRVAGGAGTPADLPVYQEVARPRPGESNAPPEPVSSSAPALQDLPILFAAAQEHRRQLSEKIVVRTPDPFINAAAAALCMAGDGVWDERQGAVMHGAVAWRAKLLGWRGDYLNDDLGWHDRALRDFTYWAGRQDTNRVPAAILPADPAFNLSRNEPSLHSNGDLSNSHYDMNLVYIDALFRHFLWTGDLAFARKVWPVIVRHLAWERRLFRRPFGPDGLPLYEAYAAIWASDDLEYEGGGAAHSTAYNYYHNKMAARMAGLLGEDPAPYEREANLILTAMRRELWLPDQGWYAEWRDWLGLRLVHPNAALWTVYHTLDSEVPTPFEAWETTRYVDTQIAHIPVRGPGVPEGFYTLPTTSWMPYSWSLNNVVMAEVQHTALAFWQAGRADEAFRMFKGSILDSMFLGLCPGNVGMCTWYDSNRRESQRDFADGVGTTSRALVEGLFGVAPDALAGELRLRPGFPADWDFASLRHPDFNFAFQRAGLTETYTVESAFPKPMALRLQVVALRDNIASVTVNGAAAKWRMIEDSVGSPRVEIQSPSAPRQQVVITWTGEKPALATTPAIAAKSREIHAEFGAARLLDIADPQGALSQLTKASNSFRATAAGTLGHRTVFAKVQQGALTWWLPTSFEIRPAYEVLPVETQDATHLRFRVRNNTPEADGRMIAIRVGGDVVHTRLQASAFAESDEIVLAAKGLLPGSTHLVLEFPLGQPVEGVVPNWKLATNASSSKWDMVDLKPVFNDKVTQIFRNQYLAPRSPFCSLAIPKQGIGTWCSYTVSFDVDDSGLRASSSKNGGRFLTPMGVPFQTPGQGGANNIAFTSQWNNYPREISVPLSGKASRACLLMAGSSNPMQSRFDNGEVVVTYTDGSTARLALRNPTTWWPIDQDYFIDDFAFRRPDPIPPRVSLRTGAVRILDAATFKGRGGKVSGGEATILDLPLDPGKELKSLTVRTLANEVVIGLMSVTLARE
ncbi:MAG: DUF4450 domain-containing protein [Verrucomicrobiota bacterium]|jgi:hypothetical protein